MAEDCHDFAGDSTSAFAESAPRSVGGRESRFSLVARENARAHESRMNRNGLALGALLTSSLLGCESTPAADAGFDARADTANHDAAAADAVIALDAFSADPLGAFCTPLAMNLCASAMTCGCGDLLPGGLDLSACSARFEAQCREAWAPFVTAGATFDPVLGAACAATIQANSVPCATPSGVAAFALCTPFAVDPAGLGEDCAAPYCAGGNGYCQGNTCVPRGAVSAPCSDMYSCATGLVCNGTECAALLPSGAAGCTSNLDCRPPLSCIDGTCEALHVTGAACTSTRDCARGLVCNASVCSARSGTTCSERNECGNLAQCARPSSCRAPLARGASCITNTDCAASLYCNDATQTCLDRPAAGARCGNGIICAAGAGCDADSSDGFCRAAGPAGSSCLFGEFGPFVCATGLACLEGTCGGLPVEGEPCAGIDVCAPGLGCAFGPKGSVCVTPGGAGASCQNRQACRADHYCSAGGTCEPDVALGTACDPGLGNCGGACVPDSSGGFTCRASVAEGDACLDVADCTSGLTCRVREEDTRCIADICAAL